MGMIQVVELTKRFPLAGGNELLAVDHVSFSVSGGQVYGLLGPNGAGKTTTVRMLLGLLRPTSGWATIAGYRSTHSPNEVKRRVGLVTAGTGVYQWLTVREMLQFFADVYGVAPDHASARINRLARLLGVAEILDRSCATLSTGQKQRVSLARAMIHNPPVMLLDEPTVGLDVMGAQVVAEFINHLRDEGKVVILCTHRLDEAQRLCDRFGLLHRGQLVSEGTLAELRARTGCTTLVEMFLKLSGTGPLLSASAVEADAQ